MAIVKIKLGEDLSNSLKYQKVTFNSIFKLF